MGRCSLHDRLMEDCKECQLRQEVDALRATVQTQSDKLQGKDDAIAELRVELREAKARADWLAAEVERLSQENIGINEAWDSLRIEKNQHLADWEKWLSDIRDDFNGVTDNLRDPERFRSWGWIEEHRPWPACIMEEE